MVETDALAILKSARQDRDARIVVHGTAVSINGRGVLFVGPAGAGKSSAALVLLGLGARLVADDRTQVWLKGSDVMLAAPSTLPALIEARGVGLLPAPLETQAQLVLVVDMLRRETDRLPINRHIRVFGSELALLHATDSVHFPYAVLQFVKGLKVPIRDS